MQNNLKRKFIDDTPETDMPKLKQQRIDITNNSNSDNLSGMTWDSVNHSCAYDALFTVIYHIWCKNIHYWSQNFNQYGEHSQILVQGLNQVVQGQITLNNARDNVRQALHIECPAKFPYGTIGTDISDLLTYMLKNQNTLGTATEICSSCNYERELEIKPNSLIFITSSQFKSLNNTFLNWQESQGHCDSCEGVTNIRRKFNQNPGLVAFSIQVGGITINKAIKVTKISGPAITLPLKGIIYLSNHHFSIHIITSEKNVWFHDGIATGSTCILEGPLTNFSDKTLCKHNSGIAVAAIYAKN